MDIKLLITDLDDTLISDTVGVSDRAVKAIEKVKEKGIKAAIATGRMHSSAFPFAKTLNLKAPIISFNGALVKHVDTDEIILHLPVKYDDAIEVLEFAKEHNKYIQYYSIDDFYIKEHCEKSDIYGYRTGIKAVATNEELIKALDFDPTKLLIICENKSETERIYNLATQRFKDRLFVVHSSDLYVEFNNLKASKGQACDALAKYYGLNLSNIMCIGNGGNDVDMIKKCGFGVAVDNAVPEAKEAADYICPSQEEDGATWAIEHFLLKR